MGANIPSDLIEAIQQCWPDGVVERFDEEESYFFDILEGIQNDLNSIPGAPLVWQTEPDADDGEFQSYHVFFVAPDDSDFDFESEFEAQDSERCNGEGRYGCSAVVSLAAPFAAIFFCQYVNYEDGSCTTPDPADFCDIDDDGNPTDTDIAYRETLGKERLAKLEDLRARMAGVLAGYGLNLLDASVLYLPVPDLQADDEVYLEAPVRVRDAFFFRAM